MNELLPNLPISASQVQEAEAEVPGVRQTEKKIRISVRGVCQTGGGNDL